MISCWLLQSKYYGCNAGKRLLCYWCLSKTKPKILYRITRTGWQQLNFRVQDKAGCGGKVKYCFSYFRFFFFFFVLFFRSERSKEKTSIHYLRAPSDMERCNLEIKRYSITGIASWRHVPDSMLLYAYWERFVCTEVCWLFKYHRRK